MPVAVEPVIETLATSGWEVRVLLGALVLLGVAACLLQKRYALHLRAERETVYDP